MLFLTFDPTSGGTLITTKTPQEYCHYFISSMSFRTYVRNLNVQE